MALDGIKYCHYRETTNSKLRAGLEIGRYFRLLIVDQVFLLGPGPFLNLNFALAGGGFVWVELVVDLFNG